MVRAARANAPPSEFVSIMQAAALLAVIAPTPAAAPAGGSLAGASDGSGLGPAGLDAGAGGHEASSDGSVGAGDTFAQALAALIGLAPAQAPPVASTPLTGAAEATGTAPPASSAASAASAASAFGASLMRAAGQVAATPIQPPTAAVAPIQIGPGLDAPAPIRADTTQSTQASQAASKAGPQAFDPILADAATPAKLAASVPTQVPSSPPAKTGAPTTDAIPPAATAPTQAPSSPPAAPTPEPLAAIAALAAVPVTLVASALSRIMTDPPSNAGAPATDANPPAATGSGSGAAPAIGKLQPPAPTPEPVAAIADLAAAPAKLVASVPAQVPSGQPTKAGLVIGDDNPPTPTAEDTGAANAIFAPQAAAPTVQSAAKPALAAKAAPPRLAGGSSAAAPDTTLADLSATPAKPLAPAAAASSVGGHGARDDSAASADSQAAPNGAGAPSPAGANFNPTSPPVAPLTPPDPAALAAANGPAIASQIADKVIKSVDGKSTRFDLTLEPAGLGQVNVKVEINTAGQVSASLSFDNPHAAAEARAHAGDLRQALEQAGFNLSQGGLSFDVGGQGASLARQNQGQPFPTAAGSGAASLAEAAEPAAALPVPPPSRGASGVNILI